MNSFTAEHRSPYFFLGLFLVCLFAARTDGLDNRHATAERWGSPAPVLLDLSLAGPLRGLASDFDVLTVFSIYHAASQEQKSRGSTELWPVMAAYLQRAQEMDPRFFDVYRLSGALLAYDAKMPHLAVQLLQRGAEQLEDNWELPFIAGFLAYDQLKDNSLAYSLMKEAALRPGTPPLTVHLAARFLAKDEGNSAGIAFLQTMIELMPEGYHAGLKQRISELQGSQQ
ncbi:MAG: hypothetical protein K9M17_07210 [Mariprofundaceae bacterium]|nr:hypothetical protein [Mariprofundaceae bacterium]